MSAGRGAGDISEVSLLFAGLSEAGRHELAQVSRLKALNPGEMLISRDEGDDDVFVVLAGTLRASIHAPNGRTVMLRDLGPGETIGELAAIDQLPRSASVEAREAARVARIPGRAFRALVAREPTLAMALLKRSIGYIRQLSERLYEIGSLPAAERIVIELLRLAREAAGTANEATIAPAPRHIDLADRLCMSREQVTRELRRLARLGLVEQNGRTLTVRNMRKLAELAEMPDRG